MHSTKLWGTILTGINAYQVCSLLISNEGKYKMATNEPKQVPAAVTDFLSEYHTLRDDHNRNLGKLDDYEHLVATLEDQITGYRKIIEELSARSDHYMRLAVEMRTHFGALQAMCREAEKAFITGPYRNNGAVSKEALQMVADDINKNDNNEEVKEIPGFLTEPKIDRLNDLKGDPKAEPKMPKGKGWATQGTGK